WNSKAKLKKEIATREVEYKVFHYPDFDIGVGQNAKGNDQLRNSWGKKEDIWVHVDQDASAHAVIKIKNRNAQIVDILAQIKGYFKKDGEIDLVYTKLKFVKSIKGSSGKVQ